MRMGFARRFRLSVGFVLVIVPLWLLFGQLDAIWDGPPAYPTALFVTIGVGLTTIAFALWPWRGDPEPLGPPWEADPDGDGSFRAAANPPAGGRRAGLVTMGVLAVAWLGVLALLQPPG